MRKLKMTLVYSLIMLQSTFADAMVRPQFVVIDGKSLSASDSMNLLFYRGKNFVIGDFKTIKINGKTLERYKMRSGETVFVRTLTLDGDTTTWESKLKSPQKISVTCDHTDAIVIPNGVEVRTSIALTSNQAILVWLLQGDKEAEHYVVNGQTQTVFICNPTNDNGGVSEQPLENSSQNGEKNGGSSGLK